MSGRWGSRARPIACDANEGLGDDDDIEAKKAELKRMLNAGQITPAQHDAELRKLMPSFGFKSHRDAYRKSHGAVQKFIPSREQH